MYKQLNNYTNRFLAAMMLVLLTGFAMAGETGEIRGTVTDEHNNPMVSAYVRVKVGETMITGTTTNLDGVYSIKNLEPGKYDVLFEYINYNKELKQGVSVSANKTFYLDISLKPAEMGVIEVTTSKAEKPIIDREFSPIKTLDVDQIKEIAVSPGDIKGMVQAISSEVLPDDNGDLYVRGSRSGSTAYMIDGNRVLASESVPGSSIGGLLVLTGGVPAEYGDFTGGLIVITTKSYTQGLREKRLKKYDFEQRLKEKEAEKAEEAAKKKAAEEAKKKAEEDAKKKTSEPATH